MSLTQRLSPLAARLAHILALRRARNVLAAKEDVEQTIMAIYFGGPVGDLYQIKQWLPIFEQLQSEFPTVVFMKDAVAALHLTKESNLPIRMAGHAEAIEPLVHELGLRAMFYVNNNLSNFSALRIPHVTHIHLSHGESEKASMTSNQLKAYDYCFVAGQASVERIMSSLSLFDESHLKMIGRPQLDLLMLATPIQSIDGRKTVLYAPTWEGDRPAMAYSSIAVCGESWIADLLNDDSLRVIYRPHPKTGTRSTSTRKADKNIRKLIETALKTDCSAGHMIDTGIDCNPAMAAADVAIFDVSAMAMDASVLKRPFFVTLPMTMASPLLPSPLWDAARPLEIDSNTPIKPRLHAALTEGPLAGNDEFVLHHFGEFAVGSGVARFRTMISTLI
ncbi:CDP-glycerol glycerophosphotransferase family protein [Paeniglutamicibacter gangotriensis]|uniref:CDP-glycerol glycerophosphotransferase family protein n=1 Tax=Paeniglutamicibacter gangotriensis TaxID=254787 RepID=UPI0037C51B96